MLPLLHVIKYYVTYNIYIYIFIYIYICIYIHTYIYIFYIYPDLARACVYMWFICIFAAAVSVCSPLLGDGVLYVYSGTYAI